MYKVGVMIMGKPSKSPKKVKEIIMEVEAKTKVDDILDYLLELKKIQHKTLNMTVQKGGRPISEESTIAQILRHTKPVNNLIKLYLYEIEEQYDQGNLDNSVQKIVFKPTKHEKNLQMMTQSKVKEQEKKNPVAQNKDMQSTADDDAGKGGFCCCC